MIILFIISEFICGALMFSYWLGLLAGKDLKAVGDGNPGAFNLWHAAGYKLGILGIIFDFMKGYIPLVFLIEGGYIRDMAVVPVAAAPILGHAFSPFMRFKGGKAIAVTFGVWSAVTRFHVSIVYACILAILLVIAKLAAKGGATSPEIDGFMVTAGMFLLFFYLIARSFPQNILALCLINLLLLIYTNKKKLYSLFKITLGR